MAPAIDTTAPWCNRRLVELRPDCGSHRLGRHDGNAVVHAVGAKNVVIVIVTDDPGCPAPVKAAAIRLGG